MRVTVLGMGRMGTAIACRLAGGGHELTVWNRSPGKAGEAVDAGAREAESLGEAVESAEVVISMLANDRAVRSVALEEGGLLTVLPPGARYVDSSTVSPTLTAELAGAFGPRFGAMPVLGGPDAVRAGTAVLLLGAAPETAATLRPVVASLADTVHHLDDPPLALVAKVTGNYLLLCGVVTLAEAFAVARAGGLSDDQLQDLLADSPLVAPALRNRFAAVLEGSEAGWFAAGLGGKDVALAVDLAASGGVGLRVGDVVKAAYDATEEIGLSGADVSAVSRLYRA